MKASVGDYIGLLIAAGVIGLFAYDWYQKRQATQQPATPMPTDHPITRVAADVEEPVTLWQHLAQPLHFAKDMLAGIRNKKQVQRLTLHQWWWLLGEAHHWLLVGETGKGKSTLAKAMMSFYSRKGLVFLIDPHYSPDDWPVRAIGAGRKYDEVNAAFLAIEHELNTRYDRRANPQEGQPLDMPLWIFIDEYLSCVANCPDASRVFKALVNEGRKVDMHLVVLVQLKTVKALGIEGEGDTRRNLGKILFGSYAVEALDWLSAFDYPAAIDFREGQTAIGIDTSQLPHLHTSIPAISVWQPELDVQPMVAAMTAEHVLVARWLAEDPGISNRQLAKRLWGGDGGGKNNAKAQALKDTVVHLFTCSLVDKLSIIEEETPIGEQVNSEQPVILVG